MRLESEQMWGYFEWLIDQHALLWGVGIVATIALVAWLICFIVATFKYGPVEAFYAVTRVVYELFARDLPATTWRRTIAIARLAFQEAIRRKVLAVVAVFIVGLLFAGWFLDPNADFPARLYIETVLTGTSRMVLLLGLFLSCFSLPADIKNKTVQTIVTKPVRSTEIVLGRVLGFTAVGTLLLAIMGVLSYVFVDRGVRHTHEVRSLAADNQSGQTTFDAYHAHTFTMGPEGGATDEIKGHTHAVRDTGKKDKDGRPVYEILQAEGMLEAKIPVLGSLRFTDRSGEVGEGLNVGYESEYQKYIEGASLMSAIWTFHDVTPERFGDTLNLEYTLKAFRTFKGDIVTGVQGTITLRNPSAKVESSRLRFIVKEFQVDQREIPRKLEGFRDGVPVELDLYDDLVSEDGTLEVIVRCDDRGQYLGMSQADLYIRAGDHTFAWNMFKAYVGIWLQMVTIICFGVMFSTFLSGPVAMIATLTCLVFGFVGGIASEVASGKIPGGGPIESMIRMTSQAGATVDLDLGNETLESAIKSVDYALMAPLSVLARVFPDFGSLDTSSFVAYGVDIFGSLLGRHVTQTACYFLVTTLVGYFFLKTRELAA